MSIVLSSQRLSRSARDDARILCMAFLALMLWEFSGLDLPLARAFGTVQGFAWRDHWITADVLHSGARYVAWAVFAALVLSIWKPFGALRRIEKRDRILWAVTSMLCVVLISMLKWKSATSCPWSLAEFGSGSHAAYVPHWLLNRRDGGPGGCFPSGHASSAFALLAGWFFLREPAPRAATLWLQFTVGAGLVLGWVQMMRGAHYLSHSLWTAWICWAVAAASFHVTRPSNVRLRGLVS